MKNEFKVSLMCMDFTDLRHQIEILDEEMDRSEERRVGKECRSRW